MLCNAYDLVRLHLWPDAKDSDSNDFMLEMMQKDDLTRKQLAKDKQNEIQNDFADETQEQSTKTVEPSKDEVNWLENLDVDKHGNFRMTTDNIVKILTLDPKLKDSIGGNDLFAQKPVKTGDLPWWKFNPTDRT